PPERWRDHRHERAAPDERRLANCRIVPKDIKTSASYERVRNFLNATNLQKPHTLPRKVHLMRADNAGAPTQPLDPDRFRRAAELRASHRVPLATKTPHGLAV